MKKILLFSALLILSQVSFAQKIKVVDGKEKIGGGSNSSLSVMIYEATDSQVEKAWKSLMKDYNAKVSTKDGVFADNATIKDMSANTVDVYAIIEKKDNAIRLIAAFDLGGAFVSSSTHSSQFKVAEKMLLDFAKKVSLDAIAEILKEAEKEQSKKQKNLDNLKSDKTDLEKDIEKYNKQIAQAKSDIEKNIKDQETATKELDLQKKVVTDILEKQKKVD
ncbi:MAG: hypothetical protein HXX09_07225 [Bacteroidetes bacterium]|nr:hypothetical protein [Bacteroidota bacterium]